MQPQIIHPDPAAEYYFAEGCHILESWNDPEDSQASIARARVAAGVTTQWHSLTGVTERYLIVAGNGRVEVDDQTETVQSGNIVVIPPGVRQRITNTGEEDLVFYAICTPRFTAACYLAID